MTVVGRLRDMFIRPPKPLPDDAISNERIDAAVRGVEAAARDLRHTSRNEAATAATAATKLLEAARR